MNRLHEFPWFRARPAFAIPGLLALAAALAAAALAISSPALADRGAINLGFGDCAAAGSSTAGITNACVSNNGSIVLYGSFIPPQPMPKFLGFDHGAVDVFTSGTTLSPWWHMETGGCRAGRISISFDFTSGPGTCTDFFAGQAVGGMDYGLNQAGLGANTVRIRMLAAVGDSGLISPGNEYYAFAIHILKIQSTGPGSCAGCLDKACFVFSNLILVQPTLPSGAVESIVTQGSQSVVTYNGGVSGSACAGANVQKGSWGSIKAIYR
ncbi:MAG: hypothetical protein HYR73_09600 [Candidatus Eisenbacteria bacterium]|nr:hypothetical protein [Candidatus Eisenbacteria bacterium]